MNIEEIAAFIDSKAEAYSARATNENPAADHIRYRHYAQALTMIANEIRADMHIEDAEK